MLGLLGGRQLSLSRYKVDLGTRQLTLRKLQAALDFTMGYYVVLIACVVAIGGFTYGVDSGWLAQLAISNTVANVYRDHRDHLGP